MFSPQFLKIVRCPITKQPLSIADDRLLAELNQRAIENTLVSRGGDAVTEHFEAGLVNHGGSFFYRADGGIPTLIADDAIPLDQLNRSGASADGASTGVPFDQRNDEIV